MNAKSLFRMLLAVTLLALIGFVASTASAVQSIGQTAMVTAWRLNVREAPTVSSEILTVIRRGESYPIVGQSSEEGIWWQIQVNNTLGWVNGRYVNVNFTLLATPTPCPHALFFNEPAGDFCPDAPMTTQAAYQPYERGFMIWFADTGSVWVFFNDDPDAGRRLGFLESDYASLPDALPQQPPSGLYQPINAFGRVWENLTDDNGSPLRDQLGWATAPETGYTVTKQILGRTSHVHTYISLPDGGVIDAYSGLAGIYWFRVKRPQQSGL